jgi:hypothetical protein
MLLLYGFWRGLTLRRTSARIARRSEPAGAPEPATYPVQRGLTRNMRELVRRETGTSALFLMAVAHRCFFCFRANGHWCTLKLASCHKTCDRASWQRTWRRQTFHFPSSRTGGHFLALIANKGRQYHESPSGTCASHDRWSSHRCYCDQLPECSEFFGLREAQFQLQ